jgi:hypothetical protein
MCSETMAFDFDNEFSGDEEEDEVAEAGYTQTNERSSDVVDELTEEEQEEDASAYMGEVDKRLEVATYYRELLKASLFAGGGSTARIVEREVRAFVRHRLEILLSIRGETARVEAQFTNEEVVALKGLVAGSTELQFLVQKVREKDRAPEPKVEVRPAPAPMKPTPATAPVPRQVPAVRQAIAPAPAATQPAPRPAAPKQSPAAPPPRPETPKQVRRQPRRPQKVEDGSASPSMEERKVVQHPVTGDDIKIRKQRVQRPAGAIPFPADLSTATHLSAAGAVAAMEQAAPGLATLLAATAATRASDSDNDR